MKIAITGHADIEKANGKKRPAGMVYDEAVFRKVYEEIGMMMQTVSKNIGVGHDDMTLITGMARGVDEIFAHYAMAQDLSLIAAIPYRKNWHKAHPNGAIEYDEILDYIERRKDSYYKEIEKGYGGASNAFFARNQYMVDIADGVISYLKYDSAGTRDTIERAKKEGKYLGNVTDFVA